MKTGDLKLSKKLNPRSSENENNDLGLDSDHSSNPHYHRFNNDNDMISYGENADENAGKRKQEKDEGRIMRK